MANQQPYPLKHDLFLILEKILPLNNEAESLRDSLSVLMPYAIEVRYPDDWFMPSQQDAEEARESAKKVLIWFKKSMPELFETQQG